MRLRFTTQVDMSPEAIAARLRDLGQVHALAKSLRGIKFVGGAPGEGVARGWFRTPFGAWQASALFRLPWPSALLNGRGLVYVGWFVLLAWTVVVQQRGYGPRAAFSRAVEAGWSGVALLWLPITLASGGRPSGIAAVLPEVALWGVPALLVLSLVDALRRWSRRARS